MRLLISARRRRAIAIALPIAIAAACAPAAQAWHGSLTVKAVNQGGEAADTFAFTAKNAGGPTLSGGTFSLAGGQQKTFSNLPAGGEQGASSWKRYVVTQTDKAGYETTIACTIDPVWDGTGKDGSIWSPIYAAPDGTHNATVELRWWNSVGYATTCEARNVKNAPATITVVKTFVGAPADARVDLLVEGGVAKAAAASGEGSAPIQVAAGTRTFGERGVEGATLTGTADARCVDAAGAVVPVLPAPQGNTWQVETAAGAQLVCTITNRHTARITIAKVTDPASDAPDRPSFSFSSTLGFFTLAHGETKDVTVNAGTYTFTEMNRTGWALLALSCSDAGQPGASVANLDTKTATVDVSPGEHVTCTFTNAEDDGGITATARGARLLPASAVRGARLSGTISGCVDSLLRAEVRGKHVRRVMFYVDGKPVRYLHRRASGRYRLQHEVAALKAGTHRLRARVRFTRSSGLPKATLRATFTRCA